MSNPEPVKERKARIKRAYYDRNGVRNKAWQTTMPYDLWLDELAMAHGSTQVGVIEAALAAFARARGFPPPPPRTVRQITPSDRSQKGAKASIGSRHEGQRVSR